MRSSTIGIVFLPFNLIIITALVLYIISTLILYSDSSQFQMYPLKSSGSFVNKYFKLIKGTTKSFISCYGIPSFPWPIL